jgi:esterase/lipase superfamily enzyme
MTIVFFATNRHADQAAPGGFGAALAPEGAAGITYGTATVTDGKLGAVSDLQPGNWSEAALAQILLAGKPIFVTLHGFDYTMAQSLQRAASLGDGLVRQGTDAIILAFCWPSAGRLVDFPDLTAAYRHDQTQAAASAGAIAAFFGQVAALRTGSNAAAPRRRFSLLCHSMGGYALAGALDLWQGAGILFDDTLLAAADERSDSFGLADGSRLGRLPRLSSRQTIYFSRDDEALALSSIMNGAVRLGHDGPVGRQNAALFPPAGFRLIDCTAIDPTSLDPDDSHQYYRTVPAVVVDIAAVVGGTATTVGTLVEQAAA